MGRTLTLLTSKLRNAWALVPLLPRALALVWQASPRYTVFWVILLAAQGLLPIATVYLTRALVNNLTPSGTGVVDRQLIQQSLGLMALMVLVMLISAALRSLAGYIRTAQAELVRNHIVQLIHRQSVAVDLSFYDSPEYYDQLHRARYEAIERPLSLLENLGNLFQNGLTLGAMILILVPYGWWLPVALLVSSIPGFYVVLQQRLRLHQWSIATTASERRAWYYFWLLTEREIAAELRLFDLGAHFQAIYQKLRTTLRIERVALARDQSLADFVGGAGGLLVTGVTMAWMISRTLTGAIALGDLAFFYTAFTQGQQLMRGLLDHAGEIYSNSLFLGDLFEFLSLSPRVADPLQPRPAPPLRQAIVCEQVTFRYPGNSRAALADFNLTIPAGQVVAIVGVNGAGKSTLIKLLCRLYDPDTGRITLDGVDLRDLALADLHRSITVLLQEPMHYNATVTENIALGDLEHPHDAASVQAAAIAAGADGPIERLPAAYDTPLGKWFVGGSDLSVGEWQRIALARAYLRQAPFMILDEPTSAMDPWAETDWLQRFRSLAQGRTALIITHRFTTAMYADIIHVMDGGRVVESGSHDDLIALGGRYAQSWRDQMHQVTLLAPKPVTADAETQP